MASASSKGSASLRSGLKVIAETDGRGARAEKGDAVSFDCAACLNKGAVIHSRRSESVLLGSRRFIAGVEYALLGMREGGYRKVRISPHLAYRDAGVEDKIPRTPCSCTSYGLRPFTSRPGTR